jgi:hypothetical protein
MQCGRRRRRCRDPSPSIALRGQDLGPRPLQAIPRLFITPRLRTARRRLWRGTRVKDIEIARHRCRITSRVRQSPNRWSSDPQVGSWASPLMTAFPRIRRNDRHGLILRFIELTARLRLTFPHDPCTVRPTRHRLFELCLMPGSKGITWALHSQSPRRDTKPVAASWSKGLSKG